MEDIKNWDIKDIKDFHQKFYTPSNATIIVTGDINKDDVFKEATKYFQNIKNNSLKLNSKLHTVEPKQDGAKRVIIHKDTQVQMIAITYHIPNFAHKDQVALSALSELLSGGKSSRLNEILIDKKQLVNTIYAYNMELKDPGVFMFLAVCNPNIEATTVEKEILNVISDIQKGDIEEEEIDKIKINSKADFIFSLESSTSVANLYGSYLVRGDIGLLFDYEEAIEKLTKKDIIEVSKKYLNSNNSTTIILKK
jgi:predicted Zn-dependent peptidase